MSHQADQEGSGPTVPAVPPAKAAIVPPRPRHFERTLPEGVSSIPARFEECGNHTYPRDCTANHAPGPFIAQ